MDWCLNYTVDPEPVTIRIGKKDIKLKMHDIDPDVMNPIMCKCSCKRIDPRGICLDCNHMSYAHLPEYYRWYRQALEKELYTVIDE